jgi:Ricin-type beta-trefoil lectin domain-like/HYR domain/Secretion system C-terminal sorting domain
MTKTINTILLCLLMLSLPSMMQAQCPGATRSVTNCKSLNDNIWDDEGFLFRELVAGLDASWKWDGPASFVENTDGTARLTGTIRHWDKANLQFGVDITFINQTYNAPAGSPYNQTGTSTSSWYYYRWGSAVLTGKGDFTGGKLTLKEHMAAFQVGNGAHQQWADTDRNGGSGWFEWTVAAQPANASYVFQPYNASLPDPKADICILLSGTPTVCGGNPCDNDVTPPTFSNCPVFDILLNTSGDCASTANWIAPTATDNCSTPSVTVTSTPTAGLAIGSCFPIGTTTVTYKATDAKGNMATCSFKVTVTKVIIDPCANDATLPTIICPGNINLTTSEICAKATWTDPTATDNCPGVVTVTQTAGLTSGSCFPIGTSTVTYKATDAKGNMATCSFTVTVTKVVVDPCANDVTPPTIICPANINLITTGPCANASWSTPTATDNCPGTVSVYQTGGLTNGSCFPLGTIKVSYQAKDAKGNVADCSFTVTTTPIQIDPCANDVTPPTIICPTNINLTTTGTCANASWTAPTAKDNCPAAVTVTQIAGPANGSCVNIGTTTVTYKATDAKGNMSTCSFTITVTKVVDPCAGIVSVRPVSNTKDKCNTNITYVAVWNGLYYTAGTNLKFTEYTNGTATLIGNVHTGGGSYNVNVSFSGRTCASAGSPKLGDGNGTCAANAGYNTTAWYYYTSTTGTMTTPHGTINITRNGPAFQVGNFANLQQNVFGASGWFLGNGTAGGDFNITLGNCETCCSGQPAITCNNPVVGFDPNKCYKIINKYTGKSLDVYGSNSANYTSIIQWSYHGGANQQWRVINNGDGTYDIKNRATGKLLDIQQSGGNCANGIKTEQYQDDNTGSQQWYLDKQADGTYKMRNKTCNKIIKVYGGSYNDGATVVLWDDFGAEYFKWRIEEVVCTAANYLSATEVLRMDASADASRARIEFFNNTGYKTDYFEVQKADNTTGDYKTLEAVNAVVKTNELQHYSVYDNNPTEGDNTYRVRAILDDGTIQVTDVKTVKFRGLGELHVFPNPTNSVINVDLSKYKGQEVDVYLYNQIGMEVLYMPIQKVGDVPVEVDLNGIRDGHFVLRVSAKGKRDVTKNVIVTH